MSKKYRVTVTEESSPSDLLEGIGVLGCLVLVILFPIGILWLAFKISQGGCINTGGFYC
jgi:hypothetical protein